jgi:hypothetical protein
MATDTNPAASTTVSTPCIGTTFTSTDDVHHHTTINDAITPNTQESTTTAAHEMNITASPYSIDLADRVACMKIEPRSLGNEPSTTEVCDTADDASETFLEFLDSVNDDYFHDISRVHALRHPHVVPVHGHNFVMTFFKTPVICGHCKTMMWFVTLEPLI